MKRFLNILFLFMLAFNVQASGNLLYNAGFENGLDGWETYIYDDVGEAEITAEDGAVKITAPSYNHVALIQRIEVEPDTNYRFSARISTKNVGENDVGAVLGFYYKTAYSEAVCGTDEKEVELYFTTKEKEVPLMLSLGGYSSLNDGTAVFENISVTKTDSVPNGAKYYEYTGEESSSSEKKFDYGWIVLAVLLCIASAAGVWTVFSEKNKV